MMSQTFPRFAMVVRPALMCAPFLFAAVPSLAQSVLRDTRLRASHIESSFVVGKTALAVSDVGNIADIAPEVFRLDRAGATKLYDGYIYGNSVSISGEVAQFAGYTYAPRVDNSPYLFVDSARSGLMQFKSEQAAPDTLLSNETVSAALGRSAAIVSFFKRGEETFLISRAGAYTSGAQTSFGVFKDGRFQVQSTTQADLLANGVASGAGGLHFVQGSVYAPGSDQVFFYNGSAATRIAVTGAKGEFVRTGDLRRVGATTVLVGAIDDCDGCVGIWQLNGATSTLLAGAGQSNCPRVLALGLVATGKGSVAFLCSYQGSAAPSNTLARVGLWELGADGRARQKTAQFDASPVATPNPSLFLQSFSALFAAAQLSDGTTYFGIDHALWKTNGDNQPPLLTPHTLAIWKGPQPIFANGKRLYTSLCTDDVGCEPRVLEGERVGLLGEVNRGTFTVDNKTLKRGMVAQHALEVDSTLYLFQGSSDYNALRISVNHPWPDGTNRIGQSLATEFYNPSLDRYFMSADPDEIAFLTNVPATGEVPTGERYYVSDAGSEQLFSVCRFYGSQRPGPNSHFFTVDANECNSLKSLQTKTPASQPRWNFEGSVFYVGRASGGTCARTGDDDRQFSATMPVYRLYNRGNEVGKDSNHRYVTSESLYQQMIAKGWKGEGVQMCVEPKM